MSAAKAGLFRSVDKKGRRAGGSSGVRASGLHRLRAGALALAALGLLPAVALSAPRGPAREAVSRPHVYLMRGLLNIFSLGMDQLAVQIQRDGIAASVYNHTYSDLIVARIAQMYHAGDHGPYILVGHSLGADAVMAMAQQLDGQDVPVALVIPVDGTGSYAAPRNVACVLNMTQREYAYMRRGPGFHGTLLNVDLSSDPGIDHLTIDKSPRVQAEALRYILATVHGTSCRPGAPGPVLAHPREVPGRKLAAPALATPAKAASPALRSRLAG